MFSGFLSEKIYFFEKTFHQNMFQLMCEKKISQGSHFLGGGVQTKSVKFQTFFFWSENFPKEVRKRLIN